VSVTDFVPFRYKKPKQYSNIEFVHYYAEDKEDFCLTQYFNKFVELMNNNPNKKILVHCLVGMSRSATIVGSYILYKKIVIEHNNNYRVEQMIKDLKECREWVDPNNGFIKQLEEFRDKLVCG
jgi:dual specificity phosphatase 12